MKQISLIALFIILALTASSQEVQRTWKMGPLTWNDFYVVGDSTLADHSYLEFFLDTQTKLLRQGAITIEQPQAIAFTIRDRSWVEVSHRTDQELQYNQVIFNLLEIHRRLLQQRLDTLNCYDNTSIMAQEAMDTLVLQVDEFCRRSQYGALPDTIASWQRQTEFLLSALPADSDSARAKKFRYVDDNLFGISFNGCFFATAGDLHTYFRNGGGCEFAVNISKGRNTFILGLGMGGSKCLKDAPNTRDSINNLYVDDPLTVLDLYAAYGFIALDKPRFRLTPFVGYGMLGFYYTPDDDGSSMGSTSGSFHFGLDLLTHLSNTYSGLSHDILSLDTKLFCTYNKFRNIENTPAGLTINLQLGISLTTGTCHRTLLK